MGGTSQEVKRLKKWIPAKVFGHSNECPVFKTCSLTSCPRYSITECLAIISHLATCRGVLVLNRGLDITT